MAQDTVILSARGQRTEKISGQFFTVLSATTKFVVELDGRIRREVRAGSRINGEPFRRISFIETEGVANTVVYDAGDSEYTGEIQVSGLSNQTFVEPYLMPANGSELRISDASFTQLPLKITISGREYTRKSFHVSIKGSNAVGVYHLDGRLMDIVLSGSERTFDFGQAVQLKAVGNPSDIALYYTLYTTAPE